MGIIGLKFSLFTYYILSATARSQHFNKNIFLFLFLRGEKKHAKNDVNPNASMNIETEMSETAMAQAGGNNSPSSIHQTTRNTGSIRLDWTNKPKTDVWASFSDSFPC